VGVQQHLASSRAGAMSGMWAHRSPSWYRGRRDPCGGLSGVPTPVGSLRHL